MVIDNMLFHQYLDSNEEIKYVIHRHWILFYKPFIKVTLLGLAAPVLAMYFFFSFQGPMSWIFYAWIGFGILFLLYSFLDWYGDAWVLTSDRILQVRWDGFFNHSAITLDFNNMLDVEYEVSGIRQRLWGYGSMSINKYGGAPIDAQFVSKPKKACSMISKLRMEYLERHKMKFDQLKDIFTDMMHDDRRGGVDYIEE